MTFSRFTLSVVCLASLLPLAAQERHVGPATNAYQVQYIFRDGTDPATRTERHYTLLVNGEHKATFKVGNRTPVVSGAFQQNEPGAILNTQFTYVDLGVNIECSLQELDVRVELHTTVELSSIAEGESGAVAGNVRNPVIRQTRFEVNATVPIGKATTLATITDPVTKRALQVDAIVTAAN